MKIRRACNTTVRTGERLAHAHRDSNRDRIVRLEAAQPFVTTGGALPFPIPAQPATLNASMVASSAHTSFFIGAP